MHMIISVLCNGFDILLGMPRKTNPAHVVIALYTAFSSNRDILAGILRYAAECGKWSTSILQLPLDRSRAADILRDLSKTRIDGFITTAFDDKPTMELVRSSGAKSVIIRPEAPSLYVDFNRGIGELAARYFLTRGRFNSFGFIRSLAARSQLKPLVEGREEGFRAALAARGIPCSTPQDVDPDAPKTLSQRLDHWLESLPKPTAILCYCDQLASQVLQACLRLKLSVPNQVSILGVDNDTLLCENVKPSISSIDPNHQQLGYETARILDASLKNRRGRRPRFVLGDNQVIERESTKSLSPSAALVRRGLDFIARHATESIGVDDVVNYLGVSRRLAFLRFQEIEKRSIRTALEDERLQQAVRLLRQTHWTVRRIAGACGYPCQQTFLAAFRKRLGVTPLEYRRDKYTP